MNAKQFDWFDLQNYSNLENFRFADWSGIISERLAAREMLEINDIEIANDAKNYWEKIRQFGSNVPLSAYPKYESFERIRSYWIKTEATNIGGIDNLKKIALYSFIYEDENHEELLKDLAQLQKTNMQWLDDFREGDVETLKSREAIRSKYRAIDMVKIEDLSIPKGVITVDLRASDEQLKQNFSAWLDNQRGIDRDILKKSVEERDLADWVNSRVVPYFDLITISNIDRSSISNHQIGDLLFPNDIDVEIAERIRKVTRKKARKIFSKTTLGLLETALLEIQSE